MIKCPKCNENVSDKSTNYVHCGHALIEDSKLFCEECGNKIKKYGLIQFRKMMMTKLINTQKLMENLMRILMIH